MARTPAARDEHGLDRLVTTRKRGRALLAAVALVLTSACAGGPATGAASPPVSGPYTGRLVVDDQTFEARLELRPRNGTRVAGDFLVRSPFELEGSAEGVVVEDLLRITVRYRSAGPSGCDGRIEGILTVGEGGRVLDGPVSVTDCNGALPGHVSFRR